MSQDENNSMLYGATAVAAVILIFTLFQAKAYFAKPSTESELVHHLRTTTEAPKDIENIRDFMESDRDLVLEQHVMDRLREMDEPVRACLTRWPSHPRNAKTRIKTDPAGRLTAFAIQDAPPNAERCMITFLKNSVLPRHADGVVHLELPEGQVTSTETAPNNPPARRDTGPTEIYWGE